MRPLPRRSRRDELTPSLRAALELGADLLNNFPALEGGEIDRELERLWGIHRNEVLKHFIAKFPGERPPLWWKLDAPGAGRPQVRPADGSVEDQRRFAEERRVADLRFLIQHKLFGRTEQRALELTARGVPDAEEQH